MKCPACSTDLEGQPEKCTKCGATLSGSESAKAVHADLEQLLDDVSEDQVPDLGNAEESAKKNIKDLPTSVKDIVADNPEIAEEDPESTLTKMKSDWGLEADQDSPDDEDDGALDISWDDMKKDGR